MPIFTNIINRSIRNDTFTDKFKLAKVTLVFKNAGRFDKINYRPIS